MDMSSWFTVDWSKVFGLTTPIPEIVVRGSLTYLILFCLMRFVLKREAGSIGISDLLLLVLLADAAQNGMADDYRSVTDGGILVLTIVGWSHGLNWLGYHFPFFQRLMRPLPLPLVRDGRMVPENMRQQLITRGELMSQLRQQGIEDVGTVKRAFMEGDGRISVICEDTSQPTRGTPKRQLG